MRAATVLAYAVEGRVVLPESVRENAFNPRQPRDEDGKWTDTGENVLAKKASELGELEKPVDIGALAGTVFRTGSATGREIYFGGSIKDAEGYRDLHGNAPVVAYHISARKVIAATGHHQLYSHFNPGKRMQDAVWQADKASGFKSSMEAFRKVQSRLMTQARGKGYDAVLFTAPPAPALHELVVIQPRVVSGHALGIAQHAHLAEQEHYAVIASRLNILEARLKKDAREVFTEWRDKLSAKITRAYPDLAGLAKDLRIPRRGDLTAVLTEALRRTWARGAKDARLEVREGRRAVRENAWDESKHPRTPAGSGDPSGEFASAEATLSRQADAIAALSDEVRDNMTVGDFEGGGPAYDLYEARKMLAKDSDKLKKITDVNSFSLWQSYDFIARVGGVHYGISKYEDPDSGDDDDDKFVYAYIRLARAGTRQKMHETDNFDKDQLFSSLRDDAAGARRMAWDENKHPRKPKGSGDESGEFAPIGEDTVLHHGTSKEYLDSILKDGIIVHKENRKKILQQGRSGWLYRSGRGKAVFLTTREADAIAYGESTDDAAAGKFLNTPSRGKFGPERQNYLGGDKNFPMAPQRNRIAEIAVVHVRLPKSRIANLVPDVHDNLTSVRVGDDKIKPTGHGWREETGRIDRRHIIGYTLYEQEQGHTSGTRPRKIPLRKIKTVRFAEEEEGDLYVTVLFDPVAVFANFDDASFTPRSALRWLGDKAFWITGVVGDRLLGDVQGAILSGIKTGKPLSGIILDVAAAFEPYIGNPDVTIDEKQLSPYRLETIIRTNVTEAYNHGRLTEFVNPQMLPFLNGVRYSAVLDERTTEVCIFLDGKVFKPGSADLEPLLPPNHFNCRSIIVPVVVGESVPAEDFITPAEVGRARELASARFLSEAGPFERYVEEGA